MATIVPLAAAAKGSANHSPGQLLLGNDEAAGSAEPKQRAGAGPRSPLPAQRPRARPLSGIGLGTAGHGLHSQAAPVFSLGLALSLAVTRAGRVP